jgi:hypothetical protein
MASKADFTPEEWATLQKGVMGAGMLVSLADRGFFDTFKEASALAKHIKQAHESGPSLLIRDLAQLHRGSVKMSHNPLEVQSETLASLEASVRLLQEKAPDELPAYREFALDVARSVAEAAKGVGAGESDALAKIEGALQTS